MTPPRYAHVRLNDVSSFLIQQARGGSRWELGQQHDDMVVRILRGFVKRLRRRRWRERGRAAARAWDGYVQPLPSPYVGAKGAPSSPPPKAKGPAAKGEESPQGLWCPSPLKVPPFSRMVLWGCGAWPM